MLYLNLFNKALTSFAGRLWHPVTLVLADGLEFFSVSQYPVLQSYIYKKQVNVIIPGVETNMSINPVIELQQ